MSEKQTKLKKKKVCQRQKVPRRGRYYTTMLREGISVEELRRINALNISLENVGFDYYVQKIMRAETGDNPVLF